MKPIECAVGDEISVVKLRTSLRSMSLDNHPLLAQYRKWVVEEYVTKASTLYLGKRRRPTKTTLVRVVFRPKKPTSRHHRIRGYWFADGIKIYEPTQGAGGGEAASPTISKRVFGPPRHKLPNTLIDWVKEDVE